MRRGAKNKVDHRVCGMRDAKLSGWYQTESSELLKGFDIPKANTVVDVGCGSGIATRFALNCGANVIACDIDEKIIDSVVNNLKPKYGDALKTIVSNSDPLPLPDEVADRVIAMEVMEHVDSPARFLSELVRIGTRGSLYLITVPDPVAEKLQKKLAPPEYWRKPNHLRIFGREELDALLESAGLKVERRVHYSFFWAMWWVLFWVSGHDLDDPEQGPILDNWTKTWSALIDSPKGLQVKSALDKFMPKSQAIIARKEA